MDIKIQDYTYTTTKWINKIEIKIDTLVFNDYAIFRVESLSNNELINSQLIKIEGEEYSNWSSDNYIVDLICQKLGYTPI